MSDKIIGKRTDTHQHINGTLVTKGGHINGGIDDHGTKNYNHLYNKPSINGQTLIGDTTIVEDKHYVHIQSMPASVWTVRHGLNKYPAVTVVDSAGTEVIGAVEYIDVNNVQLTFVGEFSGKAIFN